MAFGNLGVALRAQAGDITDDDLALIPLDQLLDPEFLQQRVISGPEATRRTAGSARPRAGRRARNTDSRPTNSAQQDSIDFSAWLQATCKEVRCCRLPGKQQFLAVLGIRFLLLLLLHCVGIGAGIQQCWA